MRATRTRLMVNLYYGKNVLDFEKYSGLYLVGQETRMSVLTHDRCSELMLVII